MLETYHLRKFSLNDLQSVMQINLSCLPENYTETFFVDLHNRYPESFIVAEDANEILGYIMCRIEMGLLNLGFSFFKKGHIVSIAVKPEHRKRGIGKALVCKAMNSMRKYNAKQCYLEVRTSNTPAVKLYEKLGFMISRTIIRYYADGEDAYVMSCKL